VYRFDSRYQRDASEIHKTGDFDLPVKKDRSGQYKVPAGSTLFTCFTSDFFVDEADPWRKEAWAMIHQRRDLHFFIITKRIHRFEVELPEDWDGGYPNVTIYSTAENQETANFRLPILSKAPIAHRGITCEPLLGPIDLSPFLGNWVENVIVGGESGSASRVCDFNWVLNIRAQCQSAGVPFQFKQTGRLLKKDGRVYTIERQFQHEQARRAGIDT
jgi:protein gp37